MDSRSHYGIGKRFRMIRDGLGQEVTLVAVTKGRSADAIREATVAGCHDFGENRVQEAEEKIPLFADIPALRWHMVGHLQRNKAKAAVGLFDMIQSVDSLRLAESISRYSESRGKKMQILLEVKIGGEDQKYGVIPEETLSVAREVALLPGIMLCGLMTMAPELPPEQTRPYFREMKGLFDQCASVIPSHDFRVLSMGMTNDYRVAVEKGSTMVRIGRAIFDP